MGRTLVERVLPTGQILQMVEGDITDETTDAIVNAANAVLQHGGAVAADIVEEGGPVIQRESNEWVRTHGLVEHDSPAWTSAGQLSARYVIHAVGPRWGSDDEKLKLGAAVRGALRVADDLHCRSVAMPAISTGIHGYPMKRAARVILSAICQYFADVRSHIQLVRLVLYDSAASFEFMQVWEDTEAS